MGSYESDNFYPTFDKKINVLKNVTLARHSSAESELVVYPNCINDQVHSLQCSRHTNFISFSAATIGGVWFA